MEKNIKKRMELITEDWEMSNIIIFIGMRAHTFHEYLQEDLKNEEGFYLDAVVPFGFKVTNMTKVRRRDEDLPFLNQIKQLKHDGRKRLKT